MLGGLRRRVFRACKVVCQVAVCKLLFNRRPGALKAFALMYFLDTLTANKQQSVRSPPVLVQSKDKIQQKLDARLLQFTIAVHEVYTMLMDFACGEAQLHHQVQLPDKLQEALYRARKLKKSILKRMELLDAPQKSRLRSALLDLRSQLLQAERYYTLFEQPSAITTAYLQKIHMQLNCSLHIVIH